MSFLAGIKLPKAMQSVYVRGHDSGCGERVRATSHTSQEP